VAEAIRHYGQLVRQNSASLEVRNNLAWLLATCPDANLRNGTEAVQLAEAVCHVAGNKPLFLDTLAAAYAEAGRFAEATKAIQKAIALAEAAEATNSIADFRQHLELFQSGKAFHQE